MVLVIVEWNSTSEDIKYIKNKYRVFFSIYICIVNAGEKFYMYVVYV